MSLNSDLLPPAWNGCLAGCHTSGTLCVMAACFQAFRCELEANKAELFLTAVADDVLAPCGVVLEQIATGGA